MDDFKDFEKQKDAFIEENERQYRGQMVEKYGEDMCDAANERFKSMTPSQWAQQEKLAQDIITLLGQAYAEGDPSGTTAFELAQTHRAWLEYFWPEGLYTPQAHLALAESYLSDPSFIAFYDGPCGAGATEFLRDAIAAYIENQG